MTLPTPAARSLRSQAGQGRANASDPSWRMRATQTVEPGVSFWQRRASAWTSGHGKGEGPFEEETTVPSLRMPTAPRRKERRSSLRRAVPAARDSISSSESPRMGGLAVGVDGGDVAGEGVDPHGDGDERDGCS